MSNHPLQTEVNQLFSKLMKLLDEKDEQIERLNSMLDLQNRLDEVRLENFELLCRRSRFLKARWFLLERRTNGKKSRKFKGERPKTWQDCPGRAA